MQSNCDLFSAKIKQSTLVHHANHQICNAPYNNRKVNDLRRPFRYLLYRKARSAKICVHAPVVAIRTHSHVALDTYDIHVDNIYRHVQLVPLSRLQHAIRQKSQQRAKVVRFCKIYPIGAFDLTSHRIIVDANNQREFFILFEHRENVKFNASNTALSRSSYNSSGLIISSLS